MPLSGKVLAHPIPPSVCVCVCVLAYTYITVKFQFHSSVNVRLTKSSVYNRLCIKRSSKLGFGVILGVGAKIFGGKVHPSSELRVFSDIFGPDLTRRVVAFCTGIVICHRRKFGQVWGVPSSPTRSRRKTPRPEGTPLDLRLPRGKIVIILRCNLWAVCRSPSGTF